jgi:hypothetical protein
VNVTSKLLNIANCLCECYIEERQRYQIVYVNVTSKLEKYQNVYVNVTSKLKIYQIVYVNVTSKLLNKANCLCECYIEVIKYSKLFM